MTTYRSLMTTAHKNAKLIRLPGESYRAAFAVALKAAWAQLRAAEAAKTQAEQDAQEASYVYLLSGSTYAHRETIRGAGGFWDAARKVWTIEPDRKGRCPRAVASLRGVNWGRETAA